jgi:hypothetical protein
MLRGGKKNCPALKVPSQCPFVLPVELRLSEGIILGRGKGKALRRGLCYEQRRGEKLSRGLIAYDQS